MMSTERVFRPLVTTRGTDICVAGARRCNTQRQGSFLSEKSRQAVTCGLLKAFGADLLRAVELEELASIVGEFGDRRDGTGLSASTVAF